MTPHDVVADSSRLLRFQSEVVYLDRMQPSESEVSADIELMGSRDSVLVVAWLWPNTFYDRGPDPFDVAAQVKRGLYEGAAGKWESAGAEEAFESASSALDRQRERRRQDVAGRFKLIVESTARAVGRSEEALKTHIQWSAPLSQLELDRLLDGCTPFPFPTVIRLCSALQLEFTDAWVLVDPQGLARRIDQSVLASSISEHLRLLTVENLENVLKKLPKQPVVPGQTTEPDIYRAPRPGGRYWSLYEALAADLRDDPEYTLTEIDSILVDAGEMRLPASARVADRYWWGGHGAKTEGRPQVSAWWAAGYRIRNVAVHPSSGRVMAVGFEALPGRAEWLANPERTAQRAYRVPGPLKVWVYPDLENVKAGLVAFADAFDAATEGLNLEGVTAGLVAFGKAFDATIKGLDFEGLKATLAELTREASNVPDDPDILYLIEFLNELGEVDRSRIERHFSQLHEAPVNAAWMTNLLTKARRQGWTVNNGTRSRPRWSLTPMATELMVDIADAPSSEPSGIDP